MRFRFEYRDVECAFFNSIMSESPVPSFCADLRGASVLRLIQLAGFSSAM
jgi:hypothetical protein